jgi:hypothetical protein
MCDAQLAKLGNVPIKPYLAKRKPLNSHAASFGPSAVRVNTETVYSARREADLAINR